MDVSTAEELCVDGSSLEVEGTLDDEGLVNVSTDEELCVDGSSLEVEGTLDDEGTTVVTVLDEAEVAMVLDGEGWANADDDCRPLHFP